ncbi:MAG: hypothetical protein JO288_03295 [Hyphomicrobiales bacterium]|nr:hypothetical protein [Hyphomicrobiales bacterium]
MKPVPIAKYLDQIPRAPGETTPPHRETSPFRPRSLQKAPSAGLRLASDAEAKLAAPLEAEAEKRGPRPVIERPPVQNGLSPREALAGRENLKAEDIAQRLADAHARGREEGLAEAEERHAADRAAAREQAVLEHVEYQRREYAQLETAIRSGFVKIEENVGAAVARILAPFLAKQAIKYAVDELGKAVRRLCAGGPPALITIRGPEGILRLLHERIADLPAAIDYVEDSGAEVVVEAGATHIVTALRPWAELLASLDV